MFFFDRKTRLAQMKKEEGNEYYKNKAYPEALQYYTEAIGENKSSFQVKDLARK